jgi:hypothetical protein
LRSASSLLFIAASDEINKKNRGVDRLAEKGGKCEAKVKKFNQSFVKAGYGWLD